MSGKKHFLVVKDGMFCENSKKGEKSYAFESITAEIVNITFKESSHGQIMKLHLVDAENFYMISVFMNSRPAYAVMMLLGNIDLLHPFTMKVSLDEESRNMIRVSQFSFPAPFKIEHEGFASLTIEEKVAVLKKRLHEQIIPAIGKKKNPYPLHPHYKPQSKNDLQGGYFDAYKSGGRVIGPVSTEEKTDPYFGMR